MEEIDYKENQYNLPVSSWITIIAVSLILLAFIFGMFELMKSHH